MATVSDVLAYARLQAQTDSNGLTNADGLIYTNGALVDFRRRLQAAGIDASQLQESYTDMVANQGTYLYPSNMFRLKSIELNYAGTQNANDYVTALQTDSSNLPSNVQSLSWFRTNASTRVPFFNDLGDWYEILPRPLSGSTAGIRIWYFLEATEYAAVGTTIGYPESLDYRILGWRVASLYYKTLNKFEESAFFDTEYMKAVTDLISTLGEGSQQPFQAIPIQDTGWSY